MDRKNEILLLTDAWCDWEASYVIAVPSAFYGNTVKTIAIDKNPKVSMGNLFTIVDCCIADYNYFSKLQ